MRTVDLFCGCGGMSCGFEKAGFQIVGAFDWWEPALHCYNQNFAHLASKLDLSKKNTSLKAIRPLAPEIIIGGPPCQDFSSAGDRQEGNRASLTISFAKIVKSLRPRYFVMENVSRAKLSNAYAEARVMFKKAGYGLTEQVLDASRCGVPQKRKRFFCIGALGESDGFLDAYLAHNQTVFPLSVREYFEENGYALDIHYYYRHPRSYERRGIYSVDEPSATIRGVNRPKPPEYNRHKNDAADPLDARALTLAERACIQTFPPEFQFGDNQMIAEQMVGNAVPVNLAYHVAKALRAFAEQKDHSTSADFSNWVSEKYGFTSLAIKDTISRIGRCNKIVAFGDEGKEEYINRLEAQTTSLSKNVRSQLKRAATLYFEFISLRGNKQE